jgi:hypothetical protein
LLPLRAEQPAPGVGMITIIEIESKKGIKDLLKESMKIRVKEV